MLRITFFFFCITIISCHTSKIPHANTDKVVLEKIYSRAGSNAENIKNVIQNVPKNQKPGALFLLNHMPEKDITTLTSEFISDQLNWAYVARDEFSWCRTLPDSVFYNEVLPYCSLDENRDNWRLQFYKTFKPLVRDCRNLYQAIDSVNLNIQKVLGVDYNVKRSKVNNSPLQAISEKMATCTGLSFLLVNAFRSVGIPARIAGTPMWTNMRGNHSWVEVWINGEWYFTEYYPDGLNKSWFVADAGRADIQNPKHWIYAASYKPSQTYYPLVWDLASTEIHAENVTERYIRLYEKQMEKEKLMEDELWAEIVLYTSSTSNVRISRKITIKSKDKEVDFGYSPSATDDLNKYLKVRLKKSTPYTLEYTDEQGKVLSTEKTTGIQASEPIVLYVGK
ncbi:MAG: transglutaminase domain-containing protein [Saprospiraceae bacterium]|nr:transglutaminase domain-containing protein [Saprospiraceae bacterium]